MKLNCIYMLTLQCLLALQLHGAMFVSSDGNRTLSLVEAEEDVTTATAYKGKRKVWQVDLKGITSCSEVWIADSFDGTMLRIKDEFEYELLLVLGKAGNVLARIDLKWYLPSEDVLPRPAKIGVLPWVGARYSFAPKTGNCLVMGSCSGIVIEIDVTTGKVCRPAKADLHRFLNEVANQANIPLDASSIFERRGNKKTMDQLVAFLSERRLGLSRYSLRALLSLYGEDGFLEVETYMKTRKDCSWLPELILIAAEAKDGQKVQFGKVTRDNLIRALRNVLGEKVTRENLHFYMALCHIEGRLVKYPDSGLREEERFRDVFEEKPDRQEMDVYLLTKEQILNTIHTGNTPLEVIVAYPHSPSFDILWWYNVVAKSKEPRLKELAPMSCLPTPRLFSSRHKMRCDLRLLSQHERLFISRQ